jgi:4-hydroxy-tetrahydrodipicolinate reductase
VRELLGTPLVSSLFHADRWDYVFTLKRQGVEPQQRRLTVFFKGEQLERHEGDTMPSEAEFVTTLDRRKTGQGAVLVATEEQLRAAATKNPARRLRRGRRARAGRRHHRQLPAARTRGALSGHGDAQEGGGGRRGSRPAAHPAPGGGGRRHRPHGPHADRGHPRLRDCLLAGALDIASSPAIGNDAAAFLGHASGVPVTADVRAGLERAQVLIDFTRPEGTLAHLKACRELGVKAVIGTTGFTDAQKARSRTRPRHRHRHGAQHERGRQRHAQAAGDGGQALATGYDIEIIEAHHRHKVDAPSGTALKMGEVIAQALGRDLKDCAVYAREGVTGERDPSTIGFSAIRGGDIVGDHTVLFAGTGERIEITHKARQPRHLRPGQPARRALPGRPEKAACSTCSTCSACAARMSLLQLFRPGRRDHPAGGAAAAG